QNMTITHNRIFSTIPNNNYVSGFQSQIFSNSSIGIVAIRNLKKCFVLKEVSLQRKNRRKDSGCISILQPFMSSKRKQLAGVV
ncbi:hypothetical protein ACJX0J_019854, partial [Zea mays]